MRSTFYVTTPIYYVNDNPHIGHAYTTILADVLARYHRNEGDEVFFLTGLDEHGQKVQQAAQKRGVPEQQHCDELAPRFSQSLEEAGNPERRFYPHHANAPRQGCPGRAPESPRRGRYLQR